MPNQATVTKTLGEILNIVEFVSQKIDCILDFGAIWKEADITLLGVTTQLSALRAALTDIQDWSENETIHDIDYHMVEDLYVSILCCKLLVSRIEELFRKSTNDSLDFAGKVELVFGTRELGDVQNLVDRQISALTLLLVASNCKTAPEQNAFLRSLRGQKIFRKVELDSAYLLTHHKSPSFIRRCSHSFSRPLMRFDLINELVINIYDRALRGSITAQLIRHQGFAERDDLNISGKQLSEAERRSRTIDQELEEDIRRQGKECKLMILGSSRSEKREIIKHLEAVSQGGYTEATMSQYRKIIHRNLIDDVLILATFLKDTNSKFGSGANKAHYESLLGYTVTANSNREAPMTDIVIDAVEALYQMAQSDLSSCIEIRFLQDIRRIAAPDYRPTESDVLKAYRTEQTDFETRIIVRQSPVLIIDPDSPRGERRKWFHQFEGLSSLLVVELTGYKQCFDEDKHQNHLAGQLTVFECVANAKLLRSTSILLVFYNVSIFKAELAQKPFKDYFPDYSGENSFDDIVEYLTRRFYQVKHDSIKIYTCFTDPHEDKIFELLSTVANESTD